MPFSRSVGSNVPSVPLVTGVLPEVSVIHVGATPSSLRLYSSRQVLPSLTVPMKFVGPVIVEPLAGLLMLAVGGGVCVIVTSSVPDSAVSLAVKRRT